MNQENKTEDWFPTMGGTTVAYLPEYFDGEKWREIPVERSKQDSKIKVSAPMHNGAIFTMVGLYGYEQAMTLAYGFAAEIKAQSFDTVKVRVQKYKVVYDIKALKIDDTESV